LLSPTRAHGNQLHLLVVTAPDPWQQVASAQSGATGRHRDPLPTPLAVDDAMAATRLALKSPG
jgi:hypothetical protein